MRKSLESKIASFVAVLMIAGTGVPPVAHAADNATNASAASATTASDTENKEHKPGEWKPVTFSLKDAEPEPEISKIPEGNAYIPKGVTIGVELTSEISSKHNHKGDPVPCVLAENLIVNGVVVAPKGAKVEATITKCRGAGLFGRSGKLEFVIQSVETINGKKIPLQYVGKKTMGSDDGAVAVVAAVSIIGGLFMKGQNVTIAQGEIFDAEVTADTDLEVEYTDE